MFNEAPAPFSQQELLSLSGILENLGAFYRNTRENKSDSKFSQEQHLVRGEDFSDSL